MMHGVASREQRSGSNSEGFFDWLRFVVNRWFFLRLSSWFGSDHGTIDQWLSPRGRGGTITEKWGAVARLVLNLINAVALVAVRGAGRGFSPGGSAQL